MSKTIPINNFKINFDKGHEVVLTSMIAGILGCSIAIYLSFVEQDKTSIFLFILFLTFIITTHIFGVKTPISAEVDEVRCLLIITPNWPYKKLKKIDLKNLLEVSARIEPGTESCPTVLTLIYQNNEKETIRFLSAGVEGQFLGNRFIIPHQVNSLVAEIKRITTDKDKLNEY